MALISQTGAAKALKKDRNYVLDLMKRFAIEKDPQGRVDMDEIRRAHEQWQQDKTRGAKARAKKSADKLIEELKRKSSDELSDYLNRLREQVDEDPISVQDRAKALQLIFQAKAADIDVRAKEGQMISREAASAAFHKAFMAGIEIVRAIPQRAAPLCEGRAARDIEAVLENEVNAAFEAIQKLHP